MNKTLVHINFWRRHHNPQILIIHGLNNAQPEELKYFLGILDERNVIGCVAAKADIVLGYMIYEVYENRLNVLHFEVHPEWHRCSIGTQMFEKLKEKLSQHKINTITVPVRESNLNAQLFLRKMGAKCVKTIREYYGDSQESCFFFEYKLLEKEFFSESNEFSPYVDKNTGF